MSILDEIVQHKKLEVKNLSKVKEGIYHHRSLIEKIKSKKHIAIIAEIKRKSPSKGYIDKALDIIQQARYYESHGASCISVLTDEKFFGGSFEFLKTIRDQINLPILCKDFIISEKQIDLAQAHGANIILLIKAILTADRLKSLFHYAKSKGLEVLVEVHSLKEFKSIEDLNFILCGVNNRNLIDFTVDLNRSRQLAAYIKTKGKFLISESGISSRQDVLSLRGSIDGVLIGESLVRKKENLLDLHVMKKPVKVKICGIKDLATAEFLDTKVDFIGLVFTSSKRQVSMDLACKIRSVVNTSKLVGVFMDQSPEEIQRIYRICQLDYVQIHGSFDYENLHLPGHVIIQAISHPDDQVVDNLYTLIDNHDPGSGRTLDTKPFEGLLSGPCILAGGLNSDNMTSRHLAFPTEVIDVSSGVESNNKKDHKKLGEFIEKVRLL